MKISVCQCLKQRALFGGWVAPKNSCVTAEVICRIDSKSFGRYESFTQQNI